MNIIKEKEQEKEKEVEKTKTIDAKLDKQLKEILNILR